MVYIQVFCFNKKDGRHVSKTNISEFINNLPSQNDDTTQFSTTNASGSTSQAANIAEVCTFLVFS